MPRSLNVVTRSPEPVEAERRRQLAVLTRHGNISLVFDVLICFFIVGCP